MPKNKGFTLIEILVVIAIIGLLTTVIISYIKGSKDKSRDLEVKSTISDLAVKVEQFDIAPGVSDYEQAFSSLNVPETISNLANKLGLYLYQYQYFSSGSRYGIVFPLTNGKYWCVDNATGQSRSKEVSGLFNTLDTGEENCDNATRSLAQEGSYSNPENIYFSGGIFSYYSQEARGSADFFCSINYCITDVDVFSQDFDYLDILENLYNNPGDIELIVQPGNSGESYFTNTVSVPAVTSEVEEFINNRDGDDYNFSDCSSNAGTMRIDWYDSSMNNPESKYITLVGNCQILRGDPTGT